LAIFDIIILVILLLAGIKGFRNGFIVETISMLAFFIGLFLALKLTFPIALKFFGDVEAFWIIALVIFIVLFFTVMWGAQLLAKAIKNSIAPTTVGMVDSVFGVVISMAKWVFICSILLWVIDSLEMELPKDWITDSYVYYPLTSLAPWTVELVSGVIPFFQDILENMDTPPRRI
jgi:membrane protein required for colicin V production